MRIQKVNDYHAMSKTGADIIYNDAAPVLKQGILHSVAGVM